MCMLGFHFHKTADWLLAAWLLQTHFANLPLLISLLPPTAATSPCTLKPPVRCRWWRVPRARAAPPAAAAPLRNKWPPCLPAVSARRRELEERLDNPIDAAFRNGAIYTLQLL
jgi:hypothetical protein